MTANEASNDSEEVAHIATASNMDIEPSKNSQSATTNSGHHSPDQRRIYLALFMLSLLSALTGLALILVWMFKMVPVTGIGVSNADQLANLHPVMMYTFMVSLNMYAILVYRTHYQAPKERLKWAHAIISGVNIVMSLLGVLAMYKSHLLANYPNFYSLHSWVGVLTNAFYLAQFALGFVSFLKPGLSQQRRATLMPWHRKLGSLILVLASVSAITGIAELAIFKHRDVYGKFAPITFVANFAGISVVVMTAITIYLVTEHKYLRPRLPEEEPLKR